MSIVTAIPAAGPAEAERHFAARLSFETDCADVAAAMRAGEMDFVLLHAVGSAAHYAARHIPGALHLPHREIDRSRLEQLGGGRPFVVYCAGPHCNGADRAAARIASLGFPVKVMIGGMTGWADEGLPFCEGEAPGSLEPKRP